MTIKKFPQSHLVISGNSSKLVIDPGYITFERGFKVEEFSDVDGFLITHKHEDHMDSKHIVQLVGEKPVFGNSDVVSKLLNLGVKATAVEDRQKFSVAGFEIESVNLPHCKMTDGADGPPNTGFLVNGIFFHPGDGIELNNFTAENLALPIAGPSIDYQKALKFAQALKAKLVIPIHYDSRFSADLKQFQSLAEPHAIKVVGLSFGEQVTIE